MKFLVLPIILLLGSSLLFAQSKVMRTLAEKYPETTTFVIYHSQFTMLNQSDDPEIAALASTIDKIKVLTFDSFGSAAKKELISDLESSGFEALMMIKHKGSNIEAYIFEDEGNIKGYFLIAESDENTMAIDVLGSPDAKQIGKIIDMVKKH